MAFGVAAGGLMLTGALFVWSGIYNVAASTDHLSVTTWLFEKVREQSIATHSSWIEAPPLDDEGMIRLGASHYEGGCVSCHGRPGELINPIVSGMLPSPPDLTVTIARRSPEEIFWIVKHGLKYTGMPAWPDTKRDDEVWALTAFLTHPLERTGDYSGLAGLTRGAGDEGRDGLAGSRVFTRCARCHESEGIPTNGDRIPRLAGQPEAYLLRSLREYAQRTRTSGAMQPVAYLLEDGKMRDLAAYYSALAPVADKPSAAHDPEQLRRGEAIATRGIPEEKVPACLSCHSGRQSPHFPALAGQHADYIAEQLRLWQRGGRAGTAYGRIMATIARRLGEQQIEDVSAYLASRPAVRAATLPVAEASQ